MNFAGSVAKVTASSLRAPLFEDTIPFFSVRCGATCRNEVMIFAEPREDLLSRHRNALLGEIKHDLVDHIVVTRINHAGHHDLKGINSAAFLRQTKLASGPEANSHIATSVQALRRVARELYGEISRGFRHRRPLLLRRLRTRRRCSSLGVPALPGRAIAASRETYFHRHVQ
jgi:hypothetical protein